MITNKNQLKKALKEGRIKGFERVYNFEENNKVKVGDIATVEKIQSNAYTTKWKAYGKETWVYFDNIDVINGCVVYYNYLTEDEVNKIDKKYLVEVSLDDKINKSYREGYSSYLYKYKFITMQNRIIEKEI